MSPELSGAIQAVASVVSAVAALIALSQIWLLRRQIATDHERGRREKAIELLREWNASLNRAHPSARNLVESFSIEQCQKLRNRIAFYVPLDKQKTTENALQGVLDKDPLVIDSEQGVLLNDNHLFQIGFLCTTLLNSLEIILQAWHNNIADRDILEKELRYLVKPDQDFLILRNFRAVMGHTETYPAIQAFAEHIFAQKNAVAPGKGRVA